MEKIFDILKNLFQDIINILAGKGNGDGVAAQVLGAIKNIFGNATDDGQAE